MQDPKKIRKNSAIEKSNDPELVEGPQKQSWYVYICESQAKHYYVGMSTDPRKRLNNHNEGRGAKMADDQGKFKIVYISPAFSSKSSARKREIQIKKWRRSKKEKLLTGEWK